MQGRGVAYDSDWIGLIESEKSYAVVNCHTGLQRRGKPTRVALKDRSGGEHPWLPDIDTDG